jgi:hypothetical protein
MSRRHRATLLALAVTLLPAAVSAAPRLALTADQQAAVLTALDDERHAEAVYAAVIAKFGEVRPFSAVIRSERTHQARLTGLLGAAGVAVPANPYATGGKGVSVPATLAEACRVAVDAEIANAALYDKDLLPRVKDVPAATAVFTALSTASTRNHLPAFERCGAGGGGRGAGLVPSAVGAALAPIPW